MASESVDNLSRLLKEADDLFGGQGGKRSNRSTLTVWSHLEDPVDVKKFREMLDIIGRHRIYIDVPTVLR